MKTLLTLLLTSCLAFTQTTGQLYYQKKAAVGYTSHYLTPSEGNVPVWVSGVLGNLNIAGTYATQSSLSAYSLTNHTHTFASLTSKPTTLSGYGITDVPNGSGTSTGTNTGDNAVNTTYAADYRAANFVSGTNYLAPNGSAALLTGFPTLNQNTTGSAATLSAVLPISLGGTSFSSQRLWRLMLTTDVSAASTSQVTGGQTIVIPAGTYIINGMNIIQTNSTTGGGQSGFYPSSTTSDTVAISRFMTQLSADGSGGTPGGSTRIGSSLYQYVHEAFMDAPNKVACATFTGRCVFSAPVTITPKVNQRSATDASNPALMKTGSYIQFEIP